MLELLEKVVFKVGVCFRSKLQKVIIMRKNQIISGILSVIVPGLGQIYKGEGNMAAAILAFVHLWDATKKLLIGFSLFCRVQKRREDRV